jgi:PleD family two-component response regulator
MTCIEEPSMEALVAVADRRLYIAKRSGRNRVIHLG